MIKLGFLMILLCVSNNSFSQPKEFQDFERIDTERVKNDIKIIKAEIDSTFFYINSIISLAKEQSKVLGWKKVIYILLDSATPLMTFVTLYLLWILNRRKYR